MARVVHSEETKAKARAVYDQHGPRAAAEAVGVPVGTVKSWASRDWLQPVDENLVTSTEARRQTIEARKALIAESLTKVAEVAAGRVLDLLDHCGKDQLRDVVGALTRAVHDLQLLTGEATSRTESVTLDAVDAEIAKLRAEMDKADA